MNKKHFFIKVLCLLVIITFICANNAYSISIPKRSGKVVDQRQSIEDEYPNISRRDFVRNLIVAGFAFYGVNLTKASAQASQKRFDTKAAYQWLKAQINPNTGMVNSFANLPKEDPSCGATWMYNQAQAIQLCLAFKDIKTAERLAKAVLKLKRNGLGWHNAYVTDSGAVATKLDEQKMSWTGPNMAIGHSLLNLLEVTQNKELAKEIVKAVIDLTGWLNIYYHEPEGKKIAYVGVGENSKSAKTEHNMRVFAFYYQLYNQFNNSRHKNKAAIEIYKKDINPKNLKTRADKIINWLQTDMWDVDHYRVGYKNFETKELIPEIIRSIPKGGEGYWDRDMWGYPQYLGPIMAYVAGLTPNKFAKGLDWLLGHVSKWDIDGVTYEGFPRWLDTRSIWAKGTGEAVVAFSLVGRDDQVERFLPTLAALQAKSGGIYAAVGDPKEGGWPINFPFESIEGLNPVGIAAGAFDANFIAMPVFFDFAL